MEILDDLGRIEAVDKSRMLRVVESFPAQCRDAVSLAGDVQLNQDFREASSLAVLGMGGSGIGGDILKNIVESESELPVTVVKGYGLPRHIKSGTLVFAVSYSGNTEETISAFHQALQRETKIIVITSGGVLAEQALKNHLPLVKVPADYQPRAALGFLFLPMLQILSRLGLVSRQEVAIAELLKLLTDLSERFSFQRPFSDNPAKQTAMRLHGKFPVIYGSESLTGPVALRWKCQFNENSKVQAFYNVFSELDHNEIVGWELLKDLTQNFTLVFLRDREENQRIARRMDITKELVVGNVAAIHEVWSEGTSRLAKIFSLLYHGDFTSVYLAFLNGVDPTPVERIGVLKRRLAED